MNKYEKALTQMCRQCKTKPINCNKSKCNRYNAFKELIECIKILKDIYSITYGDLIRKLNNNMITQDEYGCVSKILEE